MITDDTRQQYDAAVAATGSEHPSRATVMFQINRRDNETAIEFIDRVNAVLAHHSERAP